MRHRPPQGESGAVALLVAILSVVLFGAAAFVTDMGVAYSNQRDLQNGVDAAALAVGHKVAVTAKRTDDCATLAGKWNGVPANTIAQPIFAENDSSSAAALTGSTVDCESVPGFTGDQLVIHVSSTQSNPTTFGRIFGVNSLTVNRQARVITGNALPYGLRPFGVCQSDASTLYSGWADYDPSNPPAGPFPQHTVVFPNPSQALAGPCGGANGNAGLLDLDGGGGGRGGHGACTDDVKHWISCGFNGTLNDPSDIPGQTGAFGGADFDSYMAQLDGVDFAIPVYSDITGNGNNAVYHVTGFIVVNLCGWDFQVTSADAMAGSTHQYGCYNAGEWTDSATSAKATFGSQKMNFMQLQYVKTIGSGAFDKECKLGDLSCSWGTLVSLLAD